MSEDIDDGAPPPMLGLKRAKHKPPKNGVHVGDFAGFAEATCWLFNVRVNQPGIDEYPQYPVFIDTREQRPWYDGHLKQCHDEIVRACQEGRLQAYSWKTGEEMSRLGLGIDREDTRFFCVDLKKLWPAESTRPRQEPSLVSTVTSAPSEEQNDVGLSEQTSDETSPAVRAENAFALSGVPKPKPKSADGSGKKRGVKPKVLQRVMEAMRADLANATLTVDDLDQMIEKNMKKEYLASRDTCRKARGMVLAECAGSKSAQQDAN
jgi:hypothetical protein